MSSPIEALLEVANVKRSGEPIDFGAVDITTLNLALGTYKNIGIEAAVLRVIDMDTQHPVRFDSDNSRASMLNIWESAKDGKVFLFFDKYELVALIERTMDTKFLMFNSVSYKVYLSTPLTPILISDPEKNLLDSLVWVEQRVKKCFEVFPELIASEKLLNQEKV